MRALRRADEEAWLAVETPVEGTILSVTRAAALAADAAPADVGLDDLVRTVALEARVALQRTTSQLDVLAEAGVVDAGGAGSSSCSTPWWPPSPARTPPRRR